MPREPLRTTRAPAASKAAATSSAPTETAAASPGTKTGGRGAVTATPPSGQSIRSRDSRPCRRPSRVPDGPRAQLPRQKTSSTSTSAPSSPARARVSAYNASAPTDWHASPRQSATVCAAGGVGAEVLVERHHPVHLGDRQVQHVGDRLHVLARDVAELLDDVVEDGHQRAPVGEVLGGDGADERDPVGGGPDGGCALGGSGAGLEGGRSVTSISVYARHGPGPGTGMTAVPASPHAWNRSRLACLVML